MPKEDPESRPCVTNMKSSKEKSNIWTLLALRSCSSEKDSGYSDGSDWQPNQSPSRPAEPAEPAEPSQPDQDQDQDQEAGPRNPESPAETSRDPELQRPGVIQRRDQRFWRTGIREPSGPPHVVLLQPVHLHQPSSRRKLTGSYLPGLGSCPGIDPHSSQNPSRHEVQNVTKRVCPEQNSEDSPEAAGLPEHKQPKFSSSGPTRTRPSSCSPTEASGGPDSPSRSGPRPGPVFPSTRGLHGFRHRRFLNTLEVLRRSGLLDVTLHTKELQRQNRSAERDLAELRRHTDLLCRAAGLQNHASAWEHVYRVMAESGSYPDLHVRRRPPDSGSQSETCSSGDTDRPPEPPAGPPTSSPDQSCAASPQPQSGSSRKTSDRITETPPDSSTG